MLAVFMNWFYFVILYYDLFVSFVTSKVNTCYTVGNHCSDAWNHVKEWSLCIIENSAWALYFVLEKQQSRRKEIGHIWIAWGRAEEIVWNHGIFETPLQTVIREVFQEADIPEHNEDTISPLLIEKGLLTGIDVTDEHPTIAVTMYSLKAEFEPIENEEVSGVVYSKQNIIDFLEQENWYLKFRPVVLEALALHFWIDLLDEEKQILITNKNYTTKPQRIINELISVLDTWK